MALLTRKEEALAPVRRDMERFFDELGKWTWPLRPSWARWPAWMEEGEGFAPAVEVGETDDEFFVKAQVPGMKQENLDVELSDGALTIKGEVKEEIEEKKKSYYRREFSYGHFARTIPLPRGVDTNKAKAELRDGVLTVHVSKTEESKKRSVKVEIK